MVKVPVELLGPNEVKQQLAHWDEDRSDLIIYVTSVFFAIAFITVALRIAARWKQRLRPQGDDYLIVIALVSFPKSPHNAVLISFEVLNAGILAAAILGRSHVRIHIFRR